MKIFSLTNKLAKDIAAIALRADKITIVSVLVAAPSAEIATGQHPAESEWGPFRDIEADWPSDAGNIEVIEIGAYSGPTHEDPKAPVTLSETFVRDLSRVLETTTPAQCTPSLFGTEEVDES